ncbi:MAG: helix-turn-helix domain-containing protein [Bacteroidota bacterium]|nr:helix-turn-helix domain-containing protein [Bacteroidota bacterium]
MVERIRNLIEIRQLTPTQFADMIGVARPVISHILSGRNKPSLDVVQRILAAMPELSMPWLLNGTGPMETDSVQTPPAVAHSGPDSGITVAPISVQPQETGPLAQVPVPMATPAEKAASPTAFSRVNSPRKVATPAFKRFTARNNEGVNPETTPQSPSTTSEAAPAPVTLAATYTSSPLPAADQNAQAGVNMSPLPSPTETLPTPGAFSPATRLLPTSSVTDDSSDNRPTAGAESRNQDLSSHLLAGSNKAVRRIVVFYHDGSFADYHPE